jgi:uncharacterized membrane protein YphA (DoxX/SURF4 family)
MTVVTAVIASLTALLFLAAGGGKVAGQTQSLATRDHLEIPAATWQRIGLLELAGASGVLIGLAFRPLGVAAAAGLALVSLGAIVTHVRAGDPPADMAPAVVALILSGGTLVLQAVVD